MRIKARAAWDARAQRDADEEGAGAVLGAVRLIGWERMRGLRR